MKVLLAQTPGINILFSQLVIENASFVCSNLLGAQRIVTGKPSYFTEEEDGHIHSSITIFSNLNEPKHR